MDGMTDTARADVARAEGLARSALAASPRSGLAHRAKAEVLPAQHRFEEAIPEYETALSLDHNSAAALHGLADSKPWTGSIDEVIPIEEQAMRLNPRDPQIAVRYRRIGLVHLLQSRSDEAIRWLEKAHSANSELQGVHALLASAYALKGETDRAAAELAEARRQRGPGSYASIAHLRAGFTGCRRSAICSKPRTGPVCAKPGCRTSEARPSARLREPPAHHDQFVELDAHISGRQNLAFLSWRITNSSYVTNR
jgi:predicted Zn-dependent protease